MTKHISVGYDGSEPSAAAVAWAAEEAAVRGAHLHIVSCYSLPYMSAGAMGWGAPEMMDALMNDATEHATAAKAMVATSHPELHVSTHVGLGAASSALMEGRAFDDMIVVGGSGHHGAGAFWLGSTPRRLIRHSPCPVAVVRGAASREKPDRVVVGVDGSAPSDAALDWAGDHADLHHVELVLVHAWAYPYVAVKQESLATRDLMEVDAACVLDQALERARERFGCTVSGRLVEDGAVPALLGVARDGDLMVLGSRGHGALVAGLLGSTVNAVLDRAEVPVVVVRCTDEER
ncbi:MAG TPA: universal stress protein [Ilumatobacter sp.]|nr:universal stress protein [Ilumatobacter sp.]